MHIMGWWENYDYDDDGDYYYYYTLAFHSAYVLQESKSSYN